MLYEQKFLFSLLLTIISETLVVSLLLKHLYKHREIKISKSIIVSVIASALTMPYLWFVLPAYISDRSTYVFFGETLVVFIEAIVYYQFLKLKFSEAFIMSIIANMSSVFLGLI
jgi:hypothetical protein